MELKTICTIGEAVKYIKEQGANISVRELRWMFYSAKDALT